MNKRYEKFINKKTNKSINLSSIHNKIDFSYIQRNNKFNNKTMIVNKKYINTSKNIRLKNSYMGIGMNQNKPKLRLQPGMFSYKTRKSSNFSNSVESNNSIEKHNFSLISNKVTSINSSNKNQSLFPKLKLLLDNAEISSIKTLTNNENNISNHFQNHSAMNLNKYKIMNYSLPQQVKSMDAINVDNNAFNNTNYYYNDSLKYNNIIINNINQPSIKLNTDEIQQKPKQERRITSNLTRFVNKPKLVNYKNEKNNNGFLIKNIFASKSKAENESRRMIIEYLKVLKQKEKNSSKLVNILRNLNISDKVLNQQKLININLNIYTMSNQNSRFFYLKSRKKIKFPGEATNLRNISKFLKDMDDITNDKISMVKYLSVPRIMNLIFNEKNYKFIFMLRPNQFSFLKGLESYIFQFIDIKTKNIVGAFDLIKVNSCCVNYKDQKNVLIETFDGEIHRKYELITNSNNDASIFVKSINYLSRLEKCKIYNKKYLNME